MTASMNYWWKTKRRETKDGLGLSVTTGDWGSLTLFVDTLCCQESVRSTRCRLAGVNKHHHSLHSWSFRPGLPASLQAAPPHTVGTYSDVPLSTRGRAKLLLVRQTQAVGPSGQNQRGGKGSQPSFHLCFLMRSSEHSFPASVWGNNSGTTNNDQGGCFKVKNPKKHHSPDREGRGSEAPLTRHLKPHPAHFYSRCPQLAWKTN